MTDPPEKLVWTEQLIERFWDVQSRQPDTFFTHRFGRSLAAQIAKDFPKNSHLLDFGAGYGHLIPHLVKRGMRVSATDLSESLVSSINRRVNLPGFLGATTLPDLVSPTEGFAGVLCVEVIEHLQDEQLNHALSTCRSVLAKGGKLVITTPNREILTTNDIYCPNCHHTFHRWQHVRSWSPESVQDLLHNNFFQPVRVLETNFGTPAHDLWSKGKQMAARALGHHGLLPHLYVVAAKIR